jgi:hypothetical protein
MKLISVIRARKKIQNQEKTQKTDKGKKRMKGKTEMKKKRGRGRIKPDNDQRDDKKKSGTVKTE